MATRLDPAHPPHVLHSIQATAVWRRWSLPASAILGVDKQLLPWAILPVLTFVGFTWVTVIWLALDRAPLFYDPVAHVSWAQSFLDDPIKYLTVEASKWPPMVHMVLGSGLLLTAYNLDVTIAVVNLSFFAILLTSTFAIGAELWSRRVGATAAVLLALYPATFVHLRFPMLDLPLTAMVAASLFALIKTRSFQDRRWSVAFGVLVGLVALTKQSFAFPLALPVLYAIVTAPRRKETVVNVGLVALPAAVIAAPWYAPRLDWFLGPLAPWGEVQIAVANSQGHPETFTPFGLLYYLVGTWHQTSLVFALLWVLMLPLFLRSERKELAILWWAGTIGLAYLLLAKDSRYLMPALPAIALMTASGLCRMRWSNMVWLAVIAFGVLQAYAVSFGVGWLPEGKPITNIVRPDEPLQFFSQNYLLVFADTSQPDPSGWGLADSPLAGLGGDVGVMGDKIVYDATRHFHLLKTQRKGDPSTSVGWASCRDPSRLARFQVLVVQVGGPGSPVGTDEYDQCIRGMQELARIPMYTRNLSESRLKGVSYLALYLPSLLREQ